MKKPDAVTIIPKETFREKIWGLPASDLIEWDIPRKKCLIPMEYIP
jgi:hypothetical protein